MEFHPIYSIVKESYSQAPHYDFNFCISYRSHPLADGTYELIQEPNGDFSESQVNTVEITEVPNFDSEEPQHTDSIDISTGKPRCIILLL